MAYDPFAELPTPSFSSYRFFSSRAAAPDEVSTKLPSPAVKRITGMSEIRRSDIVIYAGGEKTINVRRLESLRDQCKRNLRSVCSEGPGSVHVAGKISRMAQAAKPPWWHA